VKDVVLEGMANYRQYQDYPFQRRDVRLVYDRPEQALRFSAGDIQYLTLGYQSGVRIGGVSISKDYSLQPYILTYPVGEHEFFSPILRRQKSGSMKFLCKEWSWKPELMISEDFRFP